MHDSLALIGNEDSLVLWEIILDDEIFKKEKKIIWINEVPVKVVSVKEGEELLQNGYKGKKVFIHHNNIMFPKKYYLTRPDNYEKDYPYSPKPLYDFYENIELDDSGKLTVSF
jgi:hypothetical protein